jgi:hypothetical protein
MVIECASPQMIECQYILGYFIACTDVTSIPEVFQVDDRRIGFRSENREGAAISTRRTLAIRDYLHCNICLLAFCQKMVVLLSHYFRASHYAALTHQLPPRADASDFPGQFTQRIVILTRDR